MNLNNKYDHILKNAINNISIILKNMTDHDNQIIHINQKYKDLDTIQLRLQNRIVDIEGLSNTYSNKNTSIPIPILSPTLSEDDIKILIKESLDSFKKIYQEKEDKLEKRINILIQESVDIAIKNILSQTMPPIEINNNNIDITNSLNGDAYNSDDLISNIGESTNNNIINNDDIVIENKKKKPQYRKNKK